MTKQESFLQDYNKCLADNITIKQWFEDIQEEPDAYDYTFEEAQAFLTELTGITPPDSLPLQEDCFEH